MRGSGNKRVPEINITPLVDVMLVLLVIFMITTPMMQDSLNVNLPKMEANKRKVVKEDKKIEILITKDDEIFFKNELVGLGGLIAALAEIEKEMPIILKADKEANYGVVFNILELLNKNGYVNLKLAGTN
jgi:biopolymer transport protein TolR